MDWQIIPLRGMNKLLGYETARIQGIGVGLGESMKESRLCVGVRGGLKGRWLGRGSIIVDLKAG